MIKRYTFALIAVIATMTIANKLLGMAAPGQVTAEVGASGIGLAGGLKTVASVFLGFAVGAYVLGRRALLPGLALYAVSVFALLRILHSIALPAAPEIAVVDILVINGFLFAGTFIACIMGIKFGEKVAGKRGRES